MSARMEFEGSGSLRRSFAPVSSAPGAARGALQGLSSYVEEDVLERSALVVTELVTNSIRHAGLTPTQRIGLEISVLPEVLRVEVTDDGHGFAPVVSDPEPDRRPGGWGLWLVDQLTDRWGVDLSDSARVWFEFDRDTR